MTVSFTAGNNAVSAAPQDLIQGALQEIGILPPGEAMTGDDAVWGLEKLQRLFDRFNAQREIIFNQSFAAYSLIANHAPHTIGPSGDFNVPIRPVRVVSASLVLNSTSSNPIDLPIKVRDDDWWAANPLKSMVSSITTDVFYSPDSPLGNLNFFPISNVANRVRLQTWSSLAQAIDLTTPLGFVQGYWDAVVLTLALDLWSSYWPSGKEPSGILIASQQRAIKVITENNSKPPRIDTNSGMPGNSSGRPDFNFLTGLRE